MQTRFVIFVGLGALLLLLWKFILAALVGGAIIGGYYALKSPSEPTVDPGPRCSFIRLPDDYTCARIPKLSECQVTAQGSALAMECLRRQREGYYYREDK
jgi:hypothetical protein